MSDSLNKFSSTSVYGFNNLTKFFSLYIDNKGKNENENENNDSATTDKKKDEKS